MSNEYYDHTTFPSPGAAGNSSAMRAELRRIEAAFGKLPTLAGNAGKVVVVGPGGLALTSTLELSGLTLITPTLSGATFDLATRTGLTLVNPTLSGATFDLASLTGATLTGATLAGANQVTGTMQVPTYPFGASGSFAASLDYVNQAMFQPVLPGQAGNAGKALVTDGNAASWRAVLGTLAYEQRADLRAIPGTQGAAYVVEGLGLFVFQAGSAEPDDDETAFAAMGGVWELDAASPDVVFAHTLLELDDVRDDLEGVLRGSVGSSVTSIAATSEVWLSATVPGAVVGAAVVATPSLGAGANAASRALVSVVPYVSAPDTVIVSLRNPSAAAATLVAETYSIVVINP